MNAGMYFSPLNTPSFYSCGVPTRHYIGRNVLGDNCSGTNPRMFPDSDSGKHRDVCSEGSPLFNERRPPIRRRRILIVGERHPWADEYIIFYGDARWNERECLNLDPVSYPYLIPNPDVRMNYAIFANNGVGMNVREFGVVDFRGHVLSCLRNLRKISYCPMTQ